MRILLVRPPVPKHTIGLKHIMVCEPLELEYAAAKLDKYDVQILDLIVERGFERRLKKFKPNVVCSSSYISGVNEVIKLFRKAKLWNPDVFTVAGGVQAAQVPEDFADESVDVIVRGDGTTILPQVIQAWEKGEPLPEIGGLAFPISRREVALSKARSYMPKADELPLPRRDLVSHLKHKYYYLMHRPVATMKTTWGCWYKCNFCYTWKITDGTPYSRSPENILKELQVIEAEDIYIVDDIFLIKPSRLNHLAKLIREHNIRKKYLVYARADFIAQNEDIIAEWAELGLTAVFIGLEATTDDELISMDKECSVDFNKQAIAVLKRHGVDTYGSLIPGADYMPEDWQRLWNFIEETGLYYVNISPLMPLPGTSNWEAMKDQVTVPREAHGLWDLSHILLPTKMPLKSYYRELLGLYWKTVMNISRAHNTTQRTLPSVWSFSYFSMVSGAMKLSWQFLMAHRHHRPSEIKKAMYRGPEVPGLSFRWTKEDLALQTKEKPKTPAHSLVA